MSGSRALRWEPSRLLRWFGLPLVVTGLLWSTSPQAITPASGAFALVLLAVPWVSYARWRRNSGGAAFPVFALVSSVYWVYFALPLFWSDRHPASAWALGQVLTEDSVTQAIGLACAGVAAMWLGTIIGPGRTLMVAPRRPSLVRLDSYRWAYIRCLLLAGIALSLYERSPYIFGEGWRQVLVLLATAVPTGAFAMLFRRCLRAEGSRADRWALLVYALSRVAIGLATAWLGNLPLLALAAAIVYVGERRRIPVVVGVVVTVAVLFLQPGKDAARGRYWYGGAEGTQAERATFWVSESLRLWSNSLTGASDTPWQDLASQTLGRTALLMQTADVLNTTPALVPYQGTGLYSYLFSTWIPRVFWPDKPSVNEANQFYQVAYGLTAPQDLNRVSIAIGSLTEGYIASGWLGALGVMFVIGVLLNLVQHLLLGPRSGELRLAVGVVLVLQFVQIEAQLAQYVGGIPQQLFLLGLVFLPAVRLQRLDPIRIGQRHAPLGAGAQPFPAQLPRPAQRNAGVSST